MLKLPVIEIFGEPGHWAIQGEGQYVGSPSVFVRSFGCNLRCNFGIEDDATTRMYRDIVSSIRKGVKDKDINSLEALPILPCGCDTYYSIYSEFRRFVIEYTPKEMFEELRRRTDDFNEKIHIVITGGEPLLPKYQLFWAEVFNLMYLEDIYKTRITFETNGTYKLIEEIDIIPLYFSISPKLRGSGYTHEKTIFKKAIDSYRNNEMWFKFVVKQESDIEEIKKVLMIYDAYDIPVYLMPEGGTKEEIDKHQSIVYNMCSKYGYKFSPRLQVSIFNNGIGI